MSSRQANNTTNLTNKLARGTIRFSEVEEIAEVLDHDIVFQERAK